MPWFVWILIPIALIAFFWKPIQRLLGRVKDEADDFSMDVAKGNPLATLGRGITDNAEAMDKRLNALGHWDALVKSTSQQVNDLQEEVGALDSQIEDRFHQHEEEAAKPDSDASLLTAIEEDVDRLNRDRENKSEQLKTLKATLENYEKELKERESEIYEINDSLEDAKRVHQAGKAREKLEDIEKMARDAGKNVGIDGVSAAKNLKELAEAVKRNQQARNTAMDYKRKLSGSGAKAQDPRLIERDRERRIKETFQKLRAKRGSGKAAAD